MSRLVTKLTNIWAILLTRLHVWIVICCTLLVCTSPWIFMGRSLRSHASIWDYLHIYLGLFCTILAGVFLVHRTLKGRWRLYFAWLIGDWAQLKQDIVGITQGKLPVAGGKGLFSTVEGIGMILLVAVGLTGVMWCVYQDTAVAMQWRAYHQICVQAFIGFLIFHLVLVATHIIEFIRQ